MSFVSGGGLLLVDSAAVGQEAEVKVNKGAANGYASLDGTGKVPSAQLPAGGGGPDPGDTVASETTFGVSSNAGAATEYSRADHTHGTPTNPITAHEAAGDPHPQYTTASELSTAVSNHEAASDPHTGYQKESEKNAASGYCGVDSNSRVANAQLAGSGTFDSTTFLRGDRTWAAPGGSSPEITRVAGSSGAAGADITFQRLSANASANATTTLATVMTTTGIGAGTWSFKYKIIYQAAATTTGVDFAVNHTGTVGAFVISSWFTTSGGAAANALADQTGSNTANLVEGKSQRTKDTKIGSSLGVDTLNANMLMTIEGIIVVTATGSLELKHASEVAASSQVMANSILELNFIG